MAVNMDLIALTLGKIITTPEEWKQSTWRCGTGMCFAGHAAAIAGYQFVASANSAYAEYVRDDKGIAFYDKQEETLVEDGARRVANLIEDIQDRERFNLPVGIGMYRVLAEAAKLAWKQSAEPDRFVRVRAVDQVAKDVLGINDDDANDLFAGTNTIPRLIGIVGRIREDEELNT